MKIGVQLFTVRKEAQKNLLPTLERLSNMGIKYIEAARIPFDGASASDFVQAGKKFGTKVVSTQIKYSELEGNFDNIVDFHRKVDCSTAIISVLPTEYIIGKDIMLEEFAKKAENLCKKYAEKGITLCYHHHDFEFLKSGSITRYDILINNMPNVKLVLDTYWLTKAGISTTKLIEANPNRVVGIHLRDYALIRRFASRIPKDYAVGEGVVDFAEIIEVAKKAGVAYGAIEQNTKNPFVELEKSVTNIRQLGYGDMLTVN